MLQPIKTPFIKKSSNITKIMQTQFPIYGVLQTMSLFFIYDTSARRVINNLLPSMKSSGRFVDSNIWVNPYFLLRHIQLRNLQKFNYSIQKFNLNGGNLLLKNNSTYIFKSATEKPLNMALDRNYHQKRKLQTLGFGN